MSQKSQQPEAWERRKCRAKKKYKTLAEAGAFAAHLWLNTKQMQWPYECKWCGNVHLTTERREAADAEKESRL